MLPYGQILHSPRLRAHQHNLSLHVLPRVIALLRPLAHIHQLRRHFRTLAVLRQHNRHCFITRNLFLAAPHSTQCHPERSEGSAFLLRLATRSARALLLYFLNLPKFSSFRIPRRPRPLRPIENLPVRWKLQNYHVAQSIRPQPLRHQLCRCMKPLRAALPVKSRNPLQIPLRCLPAQLIRQRRHVFLRQQRRLLRPQFTLANTAPKDHRRNNKPSHKAPPDTFVSLRANPAAHSTFVGCPRSASLRRRAKHPPWLFCVWGFDFSFILSLSHALSATGSIETRFAIPHQTNHSK